MGLRGPSQESCTGAKRDEVYSMRFEFEFSFVFEFELKYGNKQDTTCGCVLTTIYGKIPNIYSVYFCLKKYNKVMK